jgi:hypothetical protein
MNVLRRDILRSGYRESLWLLILAERYPVDHNQRGILEEGPGRDNVKSSDRLSRDLRFPRLTFPTEHR